MSNMLTLDSKILNGESIQMNNGLTDVFINVLVLSGSNIAQTIDQKRLIVWLAEKDQSKVGIGTVGFDICDMPWNVQTFDQDKNFLIKTVLGAKNRLLWECLDYRPNEEILFPCLDKFIVLLSQMDKYNVQPQILQEWLAEEGLTFQKCPKHHAFLTCFGCQICNNS